jgi:hypothetical protein
MSELDRRELLKAVALTGVAAGCVRNPAPKNSSEPISWANQLDPKAAQKVIDSFDARLSWIDKQTLPEELVSSKVLAKQPSQKQEETETFIKQSMRTLYAVGRFMDLPAEIKMHPEMQSRMASLQSDMDRSITGMVNVLETLTPDDHKSIRSFLKKDPEFAERVAAFIEEPAKEDGIPFQRRFGVRSSVLQFAGRMAAQSPGLITEPLVKKAHRLEAMTDKEHDQLLATKLGQERYNAQVQQMTALHQAWLMQQAATQPSSQPVTPSSQPAPTVYTTPAPNPPQQAPAAPPYTPPPLTAPPPNRGRSIIGKGGRIMGLGVVSTGVGALILNLASTDAALLLGAFFGITLGPTLILVGLIVLLIGLIIRASTA